MTHAPGFAPAKVNLTLHVTGKRADGYHLLDSFVVFADCGDRLTAVPTQGLSLRVDGPLAEGVPIDGSNLVLKAALALDGRGQGASLILEKHLPSAAGIGGGSSDAAAAIRVLSELWGCDWPSDEAILVMGADIPVCLFAKACRMSGIGDKLTEAPPLPTVPAVLVNPRVAVPTGEVFRRLERTENPLMPDEIPAFCDVSVLARWLMQQRNDLEEPACSVAPVIGDVLGALHGHPGNIFARMSGSGATCFGLFDTAEAAERAARILAEDHPGWWVQNCTLY